MIEQQHVRLNANTYVSLGVVVLLVAGFWSVLSGINDAKSQMSNRIDKIDLRISTLEKATNTWTEADMFRWAVHLQQSNTTLKVPEPETKR